MEANKIEGYLSRSEAIKCLKENKTVNGYIGSYELLIEEERKSGWNGFVFAAKDKDGKKVAIKFYLPEDLDWQLKEDNRNRFLNEIALLKEGIHPNLIECVDDGSIVIKKKGIPFYVMPFAKGSMRNLLEENKFKNHKFAYCFFERLGSVLKYLHEQCINEDKKGVIHRDLKPENVLIDDNDMPLLADLGIAHINPKFMIVPVKTRSDERLLRVCL